MSVGDVNTRSTHNTNNMCGSVFFTFSRLNFRLSGLRYACGLRGGGEPSKLLWHPRLARAGAREWGIPSGPQEDREGLALWDRPRPEGGANRFALPRSGCNPRPRNPSLFFGARAGVGAESLRGSKGSQKQPGPVLGQRKNFVGAKSPLGALFESTLFGMVLRGNQRTSTGF